MIILTDAGNPINAMFLMMPSNREILMLFS